ncbi:chemocyanin-like [Sesamum indicum]|uniref:Chemocyanin-like n=1 Tax=Sesamum indicum TaxID=4182 RepID=A0A6I9TA04_SESIN|nr:chemocyanin-like [Sesamum indicum]
MAPRAFLIAVIATILAIAAPASAAYNYIVGDDAGWTLGVNYTQWVEGKDFRVGDKLVFKYDNTAHNVAKVNGSDFQQCVASNASNLLTSGNDEITLSAPGKKWYICSIADHCAKGMKLVITVSAVPGAPAPAPLPWLATPTPAPTPVVTPAPTPNTSAAGEVSPLKSFVWILGALAALKVIMV